jgi:2-dehydropantoate 2-reductase
MEAIAAPLREGGFTMELTADIRTAIWTKLLMNLSSGPISVLTQSAPRFNLAEPAVEQAVRNIYAEAKAIAASLGSVTQLDVDRQVSYSGRLNHKPSILQDLELGRPMEVATLLDAPLQLARLTGVATPTLDLLVALARVRAQAAGLYAA